MYGNPFMELARHLGATSAWILYGFLVLNTLPILVLWVAGPRRWTRPVALVALQTDIYLAWIAFAYGLSGLLPEARPITCLLPFSVLLAQLAALLLVARWRLHMKSFPVNLRW